MPEQPNSSRFLRRIPVSRRPRPLMRRQCPRPPRSGTSSRRSSPIPSWSGQADRPVRGRQRWAFVTSPRHCRSCRPHDRPDHSDPPTALLARFYPERRPLRGARGHSRVAPIGQHRNGQPAPQTLPGSPRRFPPRPVAQLFHGSPAVREPGRVQPLRLTCDKLESHSLVLRRYALRPPCRAGPGRRQSTRPYDTDRPFCISARRRSRLDEIFVQNPGVGCLSCPFRCQSVGRAESGATTACVWRCHGRFRIGIFDG